MAYSSRPAKTPKFDLKRFTDQEVSHGTLSFPCAGGPLSLRLFLDLTMTKGPLRETSSKMKKESGRDILRRSSGFCSSVSGDSTSINVVRPRTWNISYRCDEADATEHQQRGRAQFENAEWNGESDVALSEEWTGTTRFHISRTKLPEGYTWVASWSTRKKCKLQYDPTRSGPSEWSR